MEYVYLKYCNKCGLVREKSDFYRKASSKDGYCSQCKFCEVIYMKQYYIKNRERISTNTTTYYNNNKKQKAVSGAKWRLCNRDKCNAKAAKRRAMKLSQTPMLTANEKKKINLYYTISNYLGADWHVDHITPLSKGGLHTPDNLQVIPVTDNLRKGDKLDYNIPANRSVRI